MGECHLENLAIIFYDICCVIILCCDSHQILNARPHTLESDAFPNQEEIGRLLGLTPAQCVKLELKSGDEDKLFQICKTDLQYKVQEKCEEWKMVDDPGMLLYCRKRDHLTCCFRALQILSPLYIPLSGP